MSESVKMPALGESVTEGTVTRWLKEVGETVEVDEPLLEVSTDKVDTEVPSPIAGVLLSVSAAEDDVVPVGGELCVIGASDETPAAAPSAPASPEVSVPVPQAPVQEAPAAADAQVSGEVTEVRMPALGESITEGTVTRWLKEIGDQVEADEPLLEVSTDKVDSEVPAPVSGYLVSVAAAEDDTVDVGAVVCVISANAPGASSIPAPAAPKAGARDASELPGQSIPSSVRQEGGETVVEWAYPQADNGYDATVSPAGQVAAPPAPPVPAPPAPVAPATPPAPTKKPDLSKPAPAVKAKGAYVTPIVRKLARDNDIDLDQLTGTGIGGRIRREDVLDAVKARKEALAAAAAAPAPAASPATSVVPSPLRGSTEKMSRLRQTIARRMIESLQTSAQLTTVVEVDVTRVAALRGRAKDAFAQREGTKLTFLPFFVKAATEALKAHPKLNATINGNEVTYHDHEHIGIAVDTPKGLFVPVIKDAGDLTIPGIAKKINDLAARTRDGKVGPGELSGSTFTITNTGSGGALFDTPIINQPEVAILGVGTIVKRPAVIKDTDGNETIGIRSMVYLAISYDHRLVDGADAARYLTDVKRRLEGGDFASEVGL